MCGGMEACQSYLDPHRKFRSSTGSVPSQLPENKRGITIKIKSPKEFFFLVLNYLSNPVMGLI